MKTSSYNTVAQRRAELASKYEALRRRTWRVSTSGEVDALRRQMAAIDAERVALVLEADL